MHISRPPHNWHVSLKKAVAIQQRLAPMRKAVGPEIPMRYIAGVDAAYVRDGRFCIAGVVLRSLPAREIMERHLALLPLKFPYIPGLLAFREGPAIIAALRKLRHRPDALICDGQGIAHPRRCGIATHLGILVDLPTIGCAKSRLLGAYQEPGPRRGDRSPLTDKGEVVGAVLRTRDKVKPVLVSVGHNIDLVTAENLILSCCTGCRLPEPTRLADHLVAAAKRTLPA